MVGKDGQTRYPVAKERLYFAPFEILGRTRRLPHYYAYLHREMGCGNRESSHISRRILAIVYQYGGLGAFPVGFFDLIRWGVKKR